MGERNNKADPSPPIPVDNSFPDDTGRDSLDSTNNCRLHREDTEGKGGNKDASKTRVEGWGLERGVERMDTNGKMNRKHKSLPGDLFLKTVKRKG